MAQELSRSISTIVKNWIDAAAVDLLDDEACLDAILHASHAVAPGQRARAMECGAAYLDLLRTGLAAHPKAPGHRERCMAHPL